MRNLANQTDAQIWVCAGIKLPTPGKYKSKPPKFLFASEAFKRQGTASEATATATTYSLRQHVYRKRLTWKGRCTISQDARSKADQGSILQKHDLFYINTIQAHQIILRWSTDMATLASCPMACEVILHVMKTWHLLRQLSCLSFRSCQVCAMPSSIHTLPQLCNFFWMSLFTVFLYSWLHQTQHPHWFDRKGRPWF